MFRITSIFLCALFLAAVAGRYSAEESVSSAQEALERLEVEHAEEMRRVQMLRAEIAYLESPERLAKVARATTDLAPPEPGSLLTAQQFKSAMVGDEDQQDGADAIPNDNVIENAIAVAALEGE